MRLLAAVLLWLTLALPASAEIQWAGGEDSDFTSSGTVGVQTSNLASAFWINGYAREGLFANNSSATDPPQSYWQTPTFPAQTVLWLHARYFQTTNNLVNVHVMDVLSPDGVTRIILRDTATNGQYKIATRNAAGTITDLVTQTGICFSPGASHTIDLFINYAVVGEVTLYCDGTSVADFTGDVTTNGATQLNQLRLAGGGSTNNGWSEVIASVANTTTMRLVSLTPVANGNADTWTVGGVSNINEVTLSDSTVNSSTTAAQIQEYTVGAAGGSAGSLPTFNINVLSVNVNLRSLVDTTGPQHVDAMVRTGSTDFASSDLAPAQGVFGPFYNIWLTNPNTTNLWSASDLSAVGFNVGMKSAN